MNHNAKARYVTVAMSNGLVAIAVVGAGAGAGCARPPKSPKPPAVAERTTHVDVRKVAAAADPAQQRAQEAWCAYLDLLYHRATQVDSPWARRSECLGQRSTASPVMLERTASCARRALERFDGDPLTAAYAAEVRRCGAEALDAGTLSAAELEPWLDAICKRAETCDKAPYAECRASIATRITERLGRAIGALNDQSRERIRACITQAACSSSMGDRLGGCVEPVMDRLLWVPGEEEH